MAITNHERVGKALELLRDGLRPFTGDNTYRALDTMARVLASASAPQADEVERVKMELLRVRFDEQARSERLDNVPLWRQECAARKIEAVHEGAEVEIVLLERILEAALLAVNLLRPLGGRSGRPACGWKPQARSAFAFATPALCALA